MIVRHRLTSVLVSIAVLAAAAGGAIPVPASAASSPPTESSVPAGDSATPRGGEITILRNTDIDGWDPDGARVVETYLTLPNVIEGLVRVGADGTTIEPGLAESWTFDADVPSYTFTLREGLTFSDGTPVTGEDVAFSVDEWVTGQRLGVLFMDLTGATAVDERTVTLELARPSTYILDFLASGIAPVVPADYAGKTREEFYAAPIGAGPFVIESYTPEVETVLVRNENYYDPARPALDRVTYRIVADPNQQLAQFEAGDADMIESLDPALAGQVDETQRQIIEPASNINGIQFNFNTPLGQDVSFRQAVNHAINRDRLVEIGFEGLGTAVDGILPPGTIGSVGCGCDSWQYDPEAAQAALDASAYAGEELRLLTETTGGDSAVLELIRADLEAIGIDIVIEELDIQVLFERIAQGDFDMSFGSYSNVSPTAGDVFIYMYVTGFFSSGAPVDEVLTAFDEFALAADADAKGEAVRGLEEWAAEAVPVLPLVSGSRVVPVGEAVGGLQVRPFSRYYLDELWVD